MFTLGVFNFNLTSYSPMFLLCSFHSSFNFLSLSLSLYLFNDPASLPSLLPILLLSHLTPLPFQLYLIMLSFCWFYSKIIPTKHGIWFCSYFKNDSCYLLWNLPIPISKNIKLINVVWQAKELKCVVPSSTISIYSNLSKFHDNLYRQQDFLINTNLATTNEESFFFFFLNLEIFWLLY